MCCNAYVPSNFWVTLSQEDISSFGWICFVQPGLLPCFLDIYAPSLSRCTFDVDPMFEILAGHKIHNNRQKLVKILNPIHFPLWFLKIAKHGQFFIELAVYWWIDPSKWLTPDFSNLTVDMNFKSNYWVLRKFIWQTWKQVGFVSYKKIRIRIRVRIRIRIRVERVTVIQNSVLGSVVSSSPTNWIVACRTRFRTETGAPRLTWDHT